MDFRPHGNHPTAFTYLLPFTTTKALVEYTLFSKNLLQENDYDDALKNYIHHFLHLQNYNVLHHEFGIIPMSTQRFSPGKGNVINIGTAGGQKQKASTGYTFQFIQKTFAQHS